MARRKIGIVGYFGYGNFGDELFIDVYRKYFYDCEISVLQDNLKSPVYSEQAYNKIGSLDAIIIGGGDTGADCLGTAHQIGRAHV